MRSGITELVRVTGGSKEEKGRSKAQGREASQKGKDREARCQEAQGREDQG